jgi:hypothetical protein
LTSVDKRPDMEIRGSGIVRSPRDQLVAPVWLLYSELTHHTSFQSRMTFRLLGFPRQVQEVHPHKDNQKSADQGYGLASIGRVEPLEKDRAGDDG